MKKYRWVSEEQLEALIEERGRKYAEKLNQDYEREILKRQVYMTVLQNQINPHFLYNSLECIRGQALLYDVPEIAIRHRLCQNFSGIALIQKATW